MSFQPFGAPKQHQQQGAGFGQFLEPLAKKRRKRTVKSLGVVPVGGGRKKKSINTKKKRVHKPKLCHSYALRNSKYGKKK